GPTGFPIRADHDADSAIVRAGLWLAPPAGPDAAIHGKDHTRGIAGAVGGQERHQVGDLPRAGGPPEPKALLQFLVAVLIAKLVLCPRLHQRDVAVGTHRSWIDADDADVVGKALAAERPGQCHQRRVAGAAADIIGIEFFTGGADVVDDDAITA